MIFAGTFVHTLDAKHRITLPARFRDLLLADGSEALLYLRPDREGRRLVAYTMGLLEEVAGAVSPQDALDWTKLESWRRQAGEMVPVKVNPKGRFVLPQECLAAAGIQAGPIRLVGALRVFFIEPAGDGS